MKQLSGIAWDISWRHAEAWDVAIHALTILFYEESFSLDKARQAAGQVRSLIDTIDPFIQKQTAVVCPHCTCVCCIDRHGSFDLHDLVYAFCLGHPVPRYELHRQETDPCQFLAATGCRLLRHERPFRCTWYVCEALIAHMQTLPAKQVREFNALFQDLQRLRVEMLNAIQA